MALSDNSADASVPATVLVAAGLKTATFSVTTSPVASNTTVTISGTLDGITRTATLTVARPSVTSVTLTPSSVTGGASSTGRVTLNGAAAAGGAVVALFADAPAASRPRSPWRRAR